MRESQVQYTAAPGATPLPRVRRTSVCGRRCGLSPIRAHRRDISGYWSPNVLPAHFCRPAAFQGFGGGRRPGRGWGDTAHPGLTITPLARRDDCTDAYYKAFSVIT